MGAGWQVDLRRLLRRGDYTSAPWLCNDGTVWDVLALDGVGLDGTGWDWMVLDGTGWYGI